MGDRLTLDRIRTVVSPIPCEMCVRALNGTVARWLLCVRVRVQCRQIQIPKVGADRNEEIIPANRLTQTTCRHYTHLH